MDLLSPIKDHHSERRVFIARVILTGIVGILLLGLVIIRLVHLQVVEYEHFAERSLGNRIRIEAVPPIRGLVFDRQGRVLAENLPAYQLELIPEQVPDIDATLGRLARLGLIEASDIERIKDLSRSGLHLSPAAGTSSTDLLSVDDIFDLDLAAELVVLSACRSGVGELLDGEGLVGLPPGSGLWLQMACFSPPV